MDDVLLYGFPGSNACLSVELLMDHAGVAYRTQHVRPGFHAVGLRLRGFPQPTVPALRVDGQRVQGSRRIGSYVAERRPEARLLPENPDERALVLDAERQGERLQNAARRTMYVLAQSDVRVVRPLLDANFTGLPRAARGPASRILVAAASRSKGATPARHAADLDQMRGILDQLDDLVDRGVLGTERPNLADFQVAPNLALLGSVGNLDTVLRARPSWRIAERLGERYPLDVRATAPAAWADRLRRVPQVSV